MKTVSLSELKGDLGACLEAVRDGDTVLVMDGGKEVARLVPPQLPMAEIKPHSQMSDAERRDFYRRSGPPLLQGTTAAEIIDALREDTV